MNSLGPEETVRSIYGLCKLNLKDDKYVGILSSHARRHLGEYTLDACSQMIASLSRAGVKNKPLVHAIVDRILEHPVALDHLSVQSLCNLMTGIARCGVSYPDRGDLWETLAMSLCVKLSANPTHATIHESVCGLLAYSYSNPILNENDALFEQVSESLVTFFSSQSELSLADILKYIKACSRVQYRSVDCLRACAQSIREHHLCDLLSMETSDLLGFFANLEKLGVDMSEVSEELRENRNVSVAVKTGETWFRQKPISQKQRPSKTPSLRKRKWTW